MDILKDFSWIRQPKKFIIENNNIEIVTEPNTDLWQRTYYHFRNDNAPLFQFSTEEEYFSFTIKTEFDSKHRFDQCGIVLYLNSDTWIKASIEYENSDFQHLGSVVTNKGYSDWATTTIDASIKSMWYRISRRQDDFLIENSEDGIQFNQMRICHLFDIGKKVNVGIYACSPEDSSFIARFSKFEYSDCKWPAHDGQKPDDY